MNILEQIVEKRKTDLKKYGACLGADIPPQRKRKNPVPFINGKTVILEVKRASPSKGDIAPSLNAEETALSYIQAGAGAISVLTEKHYFKGSLDDLMAVAKTVDAHAQKSPNARQPAVLRKDFLIEPEEIDVAYRAGADAVLLISRILSKEELCAMADKCTRLGMTAFIELRMRDDVEKLNAVASFLGERKNLIACGVNARDLSNFSIDLLKPCTMLPLLTDFPVVFESGVRSPEAASFTGGLGFTGLLLGEGAAKNPSQASSLVSSFVNASATKNSKAWLSYTSRLSKAESSCEKSHCSHSEKKYRRPLVKVCGLTSLQDALYATMGGADFLGFIFWKGSQRNANSALVKEVREVLSEEFTKTCQDEHIFAAGSDDMAPLLVGVLVDLETEEAKEALELAKKGSLDFIQLHGQKAVEQFYSRPELLSLPHYCVVNVSCEKDLELFDSLRIKGQPRILVDSKAHGAVGGTGLCIDKSILHKISEKTKLWVAGGISVSNVEEFLSCSPELIDVNSGVEKEPGVKDSEALLDFFSKIDELCSY